MRIINSDGNVTEYAMEKAQDQMRAAQCSLGLFGILVDITFHVLHLLHLIFFLSNPYFTTDVIREQMQHFSGNKVNNCQK
jgi:hypothetical protein